MSQYLLIAVPALGALWALISYNRFVTMRNRCVNGWSQIDIQIMKRHELVPKLVETVSGYAAHEREVFERAARLRSESMAATSPAAAASAEERLEGSIRALIGVAEAYPGLKADTVFLELQRDLTRLEDDIRFARQFYNDTVMRYNTLIGVFPNSLLARATGFSEREFFYAGG
ncbi:MAG: LemA family protein [Candidatus Krumholzibacteria bacterium]|nr:LemA family protein [Candidatus Krumholzibacteria bacterium]